MIYLDSEALDQWKEELGRQADMAAEIHDQVRWMQNAFSGEPGVETVPQAGSIMENLYCLRKRLHSVQDSLEELYKIIGEISEESVKIQQGQIRSMEFRLSKGVQKNG